MLHNDKSCSQLLWLTFTNYNVNLYLIFYYNLISRSSNSIYFSTSLHYSTLPFGWESIFHGIESTKEYRSIGKRDWYCDNDIGKRRKKKYWIACHVFGTSIDDNGYTLIEQWLGTKINQFTMRRSERTRAAEIIY